MTWASPVHAIDQTAKSQCTSSTAVLLNVNCSVKVIILSGILKRMIIFFTWHMHTLKLIRKEELRNTHAHADTHKHTYTHIHSTDPLRAYTQLPSVNMALFSGPYSWLKVLIKNMLLCLLCY